MAIRGRLPDNQGVMRALSGERLRSVFTLTRTVGLTWLVVLLALHWWNPVAIELLRMQGFDLYQRLAPREKTKLPVAIVDIDEKSLAELGQWPWSRAVFAQLIDQLSRNGAAAIGLDIVFAEPDRLSPSRIADRIRGLEPKTAEALRALPSNDEVLADAIRGNRVVVGRGLIQVSEQQSASESAAKASVLEQGANPRLFLLTWPAMVRNVPILGDAAAGHGVFDLPAERDGIVRRVPAIFAVDQGLQQSLSLELLRVGSGKSSIAIQSNDLGVTRVLVDQSSIPTDRRGRIWVRFAPLDQTRYLSASDVLAGRIEKSRLAGKYVLIGTSATGLADLIATPIGKSLPSVEIHAQLLETVLAEAHLFRPNYALGIEGLMILVAGVLLIFLVPTLGALWTVLLFAVVAGSMGTTSWYLFSDQSLLIDAIYPSLSVFSLYAVLVFLNYRHEELAKRRALLAYQQARLDEARLLEVTTAISSELNLDELLLKIISAASDILDAERSSLFIYDPATDELWSRVGEGLGSEEIRFPASAGLAGACFSSGEGQHIPDAYADDRFNSEFDRRSGFRTRNILSMPVWTKQGTKLGVVQVLNKKGGAFDEVDENRLTAFCAQVAIALENAQLFEDVLNTRNYNESILKSLSNGVVTVDADGRIAKVNEATARILGWGDTTPIDAQAVEVFSNGNSWITDSIDKVTASGRLDLIVDAEVHLDDEKTVSVNMTTVPLIDVQEQPIGCMLIFEDISREKRIKSTMSRYMSRELVDQLVGAGEAALGGAAQEATILFSDIRRFTTISEQLGARETVSILNDYFTDMVEIVFRHDGILDKYIGDAMMAVFGIPFPGDFDADNALKVANEMMVTLREFNRRHLAAGDPHIEIGVGIAKGEVISGNIGSLRRMDYTVIGDSVNLAARLESANKQYKTSILVSEGVTASLRQPTRLREIDLIRVKGQERAVSVFEVLDYHTDETFPRMAETLEAFALGLRQYRQRNWQAALTAFEAALTEKSDDGPSALYRDRCGIYLTTPPDDGWDGVWTMQTK